MNQTVKIQVYSSGKPKDSNLYSIDCDPGLIEKLKPSLKSLKIDLDESGLSKIRRFSDKQEYVFINEFEEVNFSGFEFILSEGNEYYFCFERITVEIKSENYLDAFRHFEGRQETVLELCLGAVTEQGEEIYTDELEFSKFNYESVE